MQPQQLAAAIAAGTPPAIIDVRTGFEFRSGHIPGAINAPLWKIALRLAPLPPEKDAALVVLCELGPRAVMARSLLGLIGYRHIQLLDGHMAVWRRAGLPMTRMGDEG